jgi:hypothetical protein
VILLQEAGVGRRRKANWRREKLGGVVSPCLKLLW